MFLLDLVAESTIGNLSVQSPILTEVKILERPRRVSIYHRYTLMLPLEAVLNMRFQDAIQLSE